MRNPVSVNVSPKQTPCQVVEPLAHTPTLRQRLMEPPRVSLHPQLPHTGASLSSVSASSAPPQNASRNSNKQHTPSTPAGPGRAGLQAKIVKNSKAQSALVASSRKVQVQSAQNPSGTSIDSVNTTSIAAGHQHMPVHRAQTSTNQGVNSGTAQSFPSITHALQSEQAGRLETSDLLSVKSLLARKLSHIVPEQDLSACFGQSHPAAGTSQSSSTACSSALTSQSQAAVSSMAGPAVPAVVSSSQVAVHQQAHPPPQTVSCVVSSASTILAPSATMSVLSPLKLASNGTSEQMNPNPQNSINLVQAAQSSANLNQLSIGPSAIQSSMSNTLVQQNTAIIGQQGSGVSSLQNSVLSIVQRNTNQYMQNSQLSGAQQNALRPSGSQSGDISIAPPQQSSVGVHWMEQNSSAGAGLSVVPQNSVTVVQQQNSSVQQSNTNIPCAILPKMTGAEHQQGNPLTVGAFAPQCSTSSSLSSSSSQLNSVTVNHSNRNPSTVVVANQGGRTLNNSNAVALTTASATVQVTTATQSISSPAVAALLTTSSHPGSHMIISTPVIAGQVQRPQSIPGQAATTVVIQTPPGTIVMPSRQVVVQANGSTAFGSIQQGSQGGTVSFIVPSQYRQNSSVTVQGLNFIQQQGTVNVVPSLALANSTGQPQTQNIMQAAQTQQNLIQAAQTQQNLVHAGTVPRQIVLASNQTKTVPVGVQISSLPGSFVRNASNICITPQEQQQQNVLIQSSAIQPLPQTMPSSAGGVTMNISQGQPSITSVQIPLQPTESQAVRSDVHLNNQQQPQQQIITQTFSPLVVIDTQAQLQQQQSILPSQCNGLSHVVNGILGSPESIGSDFPPSPLSTGIVSDKDMSNGRFMDMEKDAILEKNDIGKFMEKTKMNGYVHCFDTSSFDAARSGQPESQNFRAQAHGLSAESQGVIVNGCVSGVIQSSNSVAQRVNIPGSQGGSSVGTVLQIQAQGQLVQQQGSQQHGVQQQVVINSGRQQNVVAFVQQQQLHFQPQQQLHLQHLPLSQQPHIAQQLHVQPQQVIQQSQHQQVQIHTQPQQVFQQQLQLSRSQQPGVAGNQQQQSGSVQQLRPRISTLPCQPAPGPQGCGTAVRPVLSRDVSRDSDASNDSLTDGGDKPSQVANGHLTQSVVLSTPKNKSKMKKLDAPPVSEKLARSCGKKRSSLEETGSVGHSGLPDHGQKSVQITMEYMCEWANCRR